MRRAVVVGLGIFALVGSLTAAGPPARFPRGNGQIAFVRFLRGQGATVWLMGPGGKHQREVRQGVEPRWSRDGRRLAFAGAASDGQLHVFVADASGGQVRKLDLGPGNQTHPVFSPDGSRLAYQQDLGGVYVASLADPTDRRVVTTDPSWPSDWSVADRILFSCAPFVCTVRPDGSDRHQLPAPDDGALPGTFSPNGGRIVLSTLDEPASLFVVNVDGSHLTRLTTGCCGTGDVSPAWAPASGKIVFASDRGGGGFGAPLGIFTLRLDDGSVHRVTDPSDPTSDSPDWQPCRC